MASICTRAVQAIASAISWSDDAKAAAGQGSRSETRHIPTSLAEVLERRLMLTVTAAEYGTIRNTYPAFDLPAEMDSVNVIEVTPAQLSVGNLKSAIAVAGTTSLPDLVVLRTTDTQNTITYAAAEDGLEIVLPADMGSIQVVSFGSQSLTLDAAWHGHVLSVWGNATVAGLGGIVLAHGSGDAGGGLEQRSGQLTLMNVVISENVAFEGGGIYLGGGTSTLLNVTISGNRASAFGSSTRGGGVLQSGGTATLMDVTISGNEANTGSGICQESGTMTLTNVIIGGNTFAWWSYNNTSGLGGGVYQSGGTSTLTNVIVSGNKTYSGGGIYQCGGTSTLTNVTISGNTADNDGCGGGIYQTGGTSTLTNTIVAGNTAKYYPDIVQLLGILGEPLGTLKGSYNLIGDGTGAKSLVNGRAGNLVGDEFNPINPLFADTIGMDGTKWDLRLQTTSPGVNSGSNALIPSGLTTDLNGNPRIIDGVVNMGAYEETVAPNRPPNELQLRPSRIQEHRPAGTVVGTFTTVDLNAGDTFTYKLVRGGTYADNASFTIVGDQLTTAAELNYEAESTYSIRVRVTDQTGLSYTKTVTIGVKNINETPTSVALLPKRIAENLPEGAVVGAFSTVDPDIRNTFTYTLVDGTGSGDNAAFRVASNGRLKTTQAFDFEPKSIYSIRVRSTDQGELFCEQAITVNVTNVNEAPTDVVLTNYSVKESLPAGALVGKFGGTDADALSILTYTLVGGVGSRDNAMFTILNGKLKTAGVFDYATQSVYKVRVRVTDQDGLWFERAMRIGVTQE